MIKENLNFFDALQAVLNGSSVKRKEWVDDSQVHLSNGILCITIEAEVHSFIVRDIDMSATDWYIL